MKLKKTNAVLGLLSIAAILAHIGYQIYAFLTLTYNPTMKILTAVPFMVLACLHAVCGMMTVFTQTDGTRLDLYPKQNKRIILQRATAAMIFPLLILHLNTQGLLRSASEAGQWFGFVLLLISQPVFYAVVLTHIAVSLSKGFITLGWLTSTEKQKALDRVVYVICAIAFVIATIAVLKGQISMFLPAGGS